MGHDEQFNKIISRRFSNNKISLQTDFVAVERPLELTMSTSDGYSENLAILMRTPGDDKKLILGFLFSEGILSAKELKDVKCEISENKINLILESNQLPDFSEMKRNFISNSSCGICGKEAISEILKKIPKSKNSIETNMSGKVIQKICTKMKGEQNLFLKTGGVHAVGLFTKIGNIICIEEDVGRHNAMDKAIGNAYVIEDLGKEIIGACLSGRASYEMVQKAAMAGIEILICIGAPTSLAIDLAVACSITLVGFVSDKGYNIYTCESRILSTVN
ncbi:MAG: formate dehydrogenase family accessory protein FdhD [Euryarchaeota archaeon]|nr:formate dehydrogenase family accessory protein FdhD [Euryarchaeota archaeon]|tara:strand:- start:1765 stop:2592 length:828 start_codon:yes stop_codon:yes gene_type:complete